MLSQETGQLMIIFSSKLDILLQQYSPDIHASLWLFLKLLFEMFANLITSVQGF